MRRILLLAPALIVSLQTSIASAHPGHGDGGQPSGLMHYIFEPVHLVWILLAIAVVATLYAMTSSKHKSVEAQARDK